MGNYEREDNNHLKLIDFGLARVFKPNTKIHLSGGTLPYVAPEVLKLSYTTQCDMWSLGVIVYVLFFGYMPFAGTEEAMKSLIMEGSFKKKDGDWESVPEDARDFVSNLILPDETLRLTALAALDHPWIQNRAEHEDIGVAGGVAGALMNFGEVSALRQQCMLAMSWSLTTEDRAQMRDAFIQMDKDGSGTLSLDEFRQAIESSCHLSDEEVLQRFQSLDPNHDEQINYSDFLAAMVASRIELHDDLLRTAFHRFDKDNTGFISNSNFKEILSGSIDDEEIEKVMNEIGSEQDGKVSYDDWIHYLCGGDIHPSHHEAACNIIDQTIKSHQDHERPKSVRMKTKKLGKGRETTCCYCSVQ